MFILKQWLDYESFILDVAAYWRDVADMGVGSLIYWQWHGKPNPLSEAKPGSWGKVDLTFLLSYTSILIQWAEENNCERAMRLGDLTAIIESWCLGEAVTPSAQEIMRKQTEAGYALDSIVGKARVKQASAAPAEPIGAPSTKPAEKTGNASNPSAEKDHLPPKVATAWAQYKQAESAIVEAGEKATDRRCYNWWAARKEPIEADEETWKRYLRTARRKLGKQKNTRRAGRGHGSSIEKAPKTRKDRIHRD